MALVAGGFAAVATTVATPAGAVAPDAGTYVALTPNRLLDTRSAQGGGLSPLGTESLDVTGAGAVPSASAASAVVLNVTVTSPSTGGFITAYADQTTRPNSSNLNFIAGQTVPNLVVVPVGANGKVDFFNGSPGTTQLLVDISGYFTGSVSTPTDPGAFVSVAPSRLLDTRDAGGGIPAAAPLATTAFQAANAGGVPANATEVLLNVTAADPSQGGYITAFGDGAPRPASSNLNFSAGQTVPNLVLVPIGSNGKVALFNGSPGTTQLLADVFGYFVPGAPVAVGALQALAPARMLDTRSGEGTADFISDAPPPVAGLGVQAVQIEGRSGVPASGVAAVVLNVTVTGPVTNGYITAYADQTTRPVVSNLNFIADQTVPNLVIAPVGANGVVDLFNGSPQPVNLLVDVAGYILATANTPAVGAVHVANCDSPPPLFDLEPIQVLLDCNDFNFLYNMTWSSWTTSSAAGSGAILAWDGNEYEAAPVNATLGSPANGGCGSNFAVINLSYPGGTPAGFPTTVNLPTSCA